MDRRRRFVLIGLAVMGAATAVVAAAVSSDRPVAEQTLDAGPATEAPTSTTAEIVDTTLAVEPSTTAASVTTAAPPKTTVTTAARTTTTTAPAVRTTIGSDAKGTWTLVALDRADRPRCLELHVDAFRSAPVLCGSEPPSAAAIVGDLVSFDTPKGRAAIILVHPSVETVGSAYVQQHEPVLRDPDPSRAVAYAVLQGISANLLDQRVWRYFAIGTNVVAEVRFSLVEGTVHPGTSTISTGPPYGVYPGYRSVGTTGLYWAGNEDFGFYDAADGSRCFLYRRIGGEPATVFVDLCAPVVAGKPVAAAVLGPMTPDTHYGGPALVVLVDGLSVASWTCTLPSGAPCHRPGPPGGFSRDAQLATDRKPGSGRQVVGVFPNGVDLAGADRVTVTLLDAAGAVVAELPVVLQGARLG